MQTIGQILKNARLEKKHNLEYLERVTKIKSVFIDAIELEKWEKLPPFPTVLGFVKSIANTLNVDQKMAVAVLKRDYPPKKLTVLPKPDVATRFNWSPKITFSIGVGAIFLTMIGYLGYQYFHFISAPFLSVDSPKEGQIVNGNSVDVFGSTDSDAKITINNQPVMVSDNGKFSVSLEVVPATKEIVISAQSRSGKTSVVSRKIDVRQ